ncbi:unnamed protein product [Rhodiola kirilowii]
MQDPSMTSQPQNGQKPSPHPPFGNPNLPFRGPHHRRAHSEVSFRIPDDLDLISDPFDAPSGSFEELGSEDDLFCTYMDIEKFGTKVEDGGPSNVAVEEQEGDDDTKIMRKHRYSNSIDGSSMMDSIEAKKAMAPEKLAELWTVDPKRAKSGQSSLPVRTISECGLSLARISQSASHPVTNRQMGLSAFPTICDRPAQYWATHPPLGRMHLIGPHILPWAVCTNSTPPESSHVMTDDIPIERIEKCYLLDCIGPDGFAAELSRRSTSEIICFDHRKSGLSRIKPFDKCPKNLTFHVDVEKSSSSAAFDYFSMKLSDMRPSDVSLVRLLYVAGYYDSVTHHLRMQGESVSLLSMKDRERIESVLKYIEDGDLRKWSLPYIKAFNLGIKEWRSRLNCITNPYVFEQLLEISHFQLISKGNLQISSTKKAAKEFLRNVFRIRLGRGLYGECLGVRADGNSNLSDEIGKMLSIKSAAAGLRPIGAVIYMQRQNLKMCLRSTDARIDTSEVAKAYGGGGNHSSSSFMIRMDEYNKWRNESDR